MDSKPDGDSIFVSRGSGPSSKTPASDHTSYVPQFQTTASLVLERIQKPAEKSSAVAALNGPSSLVTFGISAESKVSPSDPGQSLSATLQLPASASHVTSGFAGLDSPSASMKRKRESPTDAEDFLQKTMALPWVDSPAGTSRQPTDVADGPSCAECGGPSGPLNGSLVVCKRCERSWHRGCHALAPKDSTAFMCATCTSDQHVAIIMTKSDQQRQEHIEHLRQKKLASFPNGITPAKPELVGFGPREAPNASRTQYFNTVKKTDLLNVLSLCDQLKPQLLVDILVSVSRKHPDLPIFNAPDWESQLSSASGAPTKVRKVSHHQAEDRPRHGHTLSSGAKARPRPRATKKILKRTRVIEVVADAPGVADDVLPPTWTKADEGPYSKLPADTEDGSLLADDNDEESFSQFMVDKLGRQVVEPTGA